MTEADHTSIARAALINRMKLAVTIAVIRCKPDHMTSKQFAESLEKRVRKRQSDWKARAEKLASDLLRTQQELAMARMREEGYFLERHSMDWDDMQTESSDHRLADVPPPAAHAEICYPTPPSSIPHPPTVSQPDLQEQSLRSNTQFLHSMSRLKTLAATQGHLDHLVASDVMRTFANTALKGMLHIEEYSASAHRVLPWQLMKEAVLGIIRTIEGPISVELRNELLSGALQLARQLLQLVVSKGHPKNHQMQQNLCILVSTLASCESLTISIVDRTVSHLQMVANMLRRSIATTTAVLDPLLYNNSFYLLTVIEDSLLSHGTSLSSVGGGDSQSRHSWREGKLLEWSETLEDCLLHITDEFVLFSHTVWRLLAILDGLKGGISR